MGSVVDTPGLRDVDQEKQREAAAVITSVLKAAAEHDYKLVFVVSGSDGRIKEEDLACIKAILVILPQDPPIHYGLIVNKYSLEQYYEYEVEEDKTVFWAEFFEQNFKKFKFPKKHYPREYVLIPRLQGLTDRSTFAKRDQFLFTLPTTDEDRHYQYEV